MGEKMSKDEIALFMLMKFWGVIFVIMGFALGASAIFPIVEMNSDLSLGHIIFTSIIILITGIATFAVGHLTLKEQNMENTKKELNKEAKMKCPKCKEEEQWDNFCSNCGNQLKEKCPECGQMEQIGRRVCETKLKEAEEALSAYISRKVGDWRTLFAVLWTLASMVTTVSALIYTACVYFDCFTIKMPVGWKPMLLIDILLIISLIYPFRLGDSWQSKARDRAKKEFFRLHPDCLELIDE